MKIGIVCYPTFGGSGVVATELGKALSETGNTVHFISYAQPARLNVFSDNLFYHEVSIKNYPLFDYPPYETSLTSKLVEIAEFEKLDIIHVHYAIPHASSALLAKEILKDMGKNIPVITTLHGTDITLVGKDPSCKPVINYSINKSDGVTAVSNSLKNETVSIFNISNEIDVIPNFIDINKYQKVKRNPYRGKLCSKGERLIIHTSNFRKVKRIQDVINIFCKINKEIPSKLIMIGDGPERANIESLTRSLCSLKDVMFIGKIPDVENVLHNADLFLLTSEKESFGLSALEAMASSVPVISSNAGGLPELVQDGVSGYTCDIGDVNTMSEKAIEILDKKNINLFKNNALNTASKYDISIILPKYIEFYKKILN
ncbi:MAG: N-acetyl-alpha-D-glucosaminyl L-malate synthase BshA [Bacteroidota bacterium]|nr:N-acetyl-alpha-D-glucosaminyl L-malate synthase BshA [Bacteroidota bacterium]